MTDRIYPTEEYFINLYPDGHTGAARYSFSSAKVTGADSALAILKVTVTGRKVTAEVVHEYFA